MAVSIQTRSGKKGTTHTVTVRVPGHKSRTGTFKRLSDAKKWGVRIEADIKEGRGAVPVKIALTVGEAIDKYLAEVTTTKAKSTQARERGIAAQLERSLGTATRISHVTPAVMAKYRTGRTATGLSAYSVRLELAFFSDLCRRAAREWGYTALQNPVEQIARPPVPRGRTLFLTSAQSDALLLECKKSRNRMLYPYVLTLLHTAMRPGEAAALRWAQVDLAGRVIELTDTKNGDIRRVPLTNTLTDTLKQLKKPAFLYVFLGKKQPQTIAGEHFRTAFRHARNRAGLQGLHMHDLRHTAASHMLMAGVDVRTLAALLGHRTMQMVMRYTHLLDEHKSAAVAKLDSLGAGALRPGADMADYQI